MVRIVHDPALSHAHLRRVNWGRPLPCERPLGNPYGFQGHVDSGHLRRSRSARLTLIPASYPLDDPATLVSATAADASIALVHISASNRNSRFTVVCRSNCSSVTGS